MPTITLEPEVIDVPEPDISHIITEADRPLVNIFSERQMRLLTNSLYASWSGPGEERPFVAMANVGLFFAPHEDPVVPDVLVSLDVRPPADVWPKQHRSYFIWEYGKPPEVVVEIVSNRKGGELGHKLHTYARIGVAYYIVYDPDEQLGNKVLRIYERRRTTYVEIAEYWLGDMNIGLTLWDGEFEGINATWLRWCDDDGQVLPTGEEAAQQERQRAEQERQRAEQEHQRAEHEQQRAERLAAQLRALGVEPEA